MKMSLAQVLWKMVIDEGHGTRPQDDGSFPVFLTHTPEALDDCITIYDTTGIKLGRLMEGEVVQREGAMIRIRSSSYSDGWNKGKDLVEMVDGARKKEVDLDAGDFGGMEGDFSNFVIDSLMRESTLLVVGTESAGERRRQIFTLNITGVLPEPSPYLVITHEYVARVEGDGGVVFDVEEVDSLYRIFSF